jgi:hypothetical protein
LQNNANSKIVTGTNGEGLKDQIGGCGAITKWNFERTPNDVKFQWYASGQLPIGTKACVGRALQSAGESGDGNCQALESVALLDAPLELKTGRDTATTASTSSRAPPPTNVPLVLRTGLGMAMIVSIYSRLQRLSEMGD